ncbi:MAG TPA: hypothetical protein VGN13_11940 [Solirubrobacteraceae bacterium]|jgi:hypothetical protein
MRRVHAAGALLATIAALALAGAAPAAAESPWWHLYSGARPTTLAAGVATDEVQEMTVSATSGSVFLAEPKALEEFNEGKLELEEVPFTAVPYDATAQQLQEQLETLFPSHRVVVTGGPGDEAGDKPYVITYPGQSVAPVFANGEFAALLGLGEALSGGRAEVSVTERSKGKPDGQLILSAANLGDAPTSGVVSIADKVPAGLTPVSIEAIAGESAENELRFENAKREHVPAPVKCTLSSLTCTYGSERNLPPYEQIEVRIGVLVAGAAASASQEMTVSGGGAAPASISRPVAIGGAAAAFGVEDFRQDLEGEGGTPDTQAGSHPFQFTTTLALNQTAAAEPVAQPKDLSFALPPGLIGNPTSFPQCTSTQFFKRIQETDNECPQDTVVGVVRVTVNEPVQEGLITFTLPVFNLEPAEGEPARFGFLVEFTPVYIDTAVRTGGDYGITATASNVSQAVGLLRSEVTLWGVPGSTAHDRQRGWGCLEATRGGTPLLPCEPLKQANPNPFLELPTSCSGPLHSSVAMSSWAQPHEASSFEPTEQLEALDGCNRLPFDPTIRLAPDGQDASSPAGVSVDLHVPQEASANPGGLAESDVKDISVTLPEGVTLNPAAADGLQACSEAQIGFLSGPPDELRFTSGLPEPFCPQASKVANVTITTPLLPRPLTGAVYLATPAPAGEAGKNPFGSLIALYLVAEDPVSGSRVKLPGEASLDPVSGRITTTFANNPQLPFEDAELHFFGGDRASLATPPRCGTYTTDASFTPWAGGAAAASASSFQITAGPAGSPCPSAIPFAPTLAAGTTSNAAGSLSSLTTTISREDGQQSLQSAQLHMPPGLSGLLPGVALCPEAQANAGTCGPQSLIGHSVVSVGLGADPFTVTGGQVFLTESYHGAPFGLSIVTPAVAGPFDLGDVVVRARIEVDPQTAALTVTTDPSGAHAIPRILDGIPLQIKRATVTVDRPGFTFNPTNCAPMALTGTIGSAEGSSVPVSTPFQLANCATLKFAPNFSVSTSGRTSKAGGASLSVKLSYPKAPFGTQANIGRVKVDLPKQLPSRLTTLQKACLAAAFAANPATCPAASIVGHAKVITPVLPVPLEGPAYFVSHGGEAFPSLTMVLQGYGVKIDLVGSTFISRQGITSTTFKSPPDVPFNTFELTLPQGRYSALAANGNLCKSKLAMPTMFMGQNGAVIHQNTKIAVTGCPKARKHAKKKAKRSQAKRSPRRRH